MMVYVGVPFCPQRCTYCCWTNNFDVKDRFGKRQRDDYVAALLREIRGYKNDDEKAQVATSVFFGGGTPTILADEQLISLIEAVRETFVVHDEIQVTLEGSPRTALERDFGRLIDAGFNRVSIGAESFGNRNLEILGRKETADDIERCLDHIRNGGQAELNLDLMFGFPGEKEHILESIQAAARLQVDHLSVYPYFPAHNTVMYQQIKDEPKRLLKPEQLFKDYTDSADCLSKFGYKEYIFSLFAKKGSESDYESGSFNLSDELKGFGLGAHSMQKQKRVIGSLNISGFLGGQERPGRGAAAP